MRSETEPNPRHSLDRGLPGSVMVQAERYYALMQINECRSNQRDYWRVPLIGPA